MVSLHNIRKSVIIRSPEHARNVDKPLSGNFTEDQNTHIVKSMTEKTVGGTLICLLVWKTSDSYIPNVKNPLKM